MSGSELFCHDMKQVGWPLRDAGMVMELAEFTCSRGQGSLLVQGRSFGLGVLQISQTEQVAQHGSGTLAIRPNKYWALIIL